MEEPQHKKITMMEEKLDNLTSEIKDVKRLFNDEVEYVTKKRKYEDIFNIAGSSRNDAKYRIVDTLKQAKTTPAASKEIANQASKTIGIQTRSKSSQSLPNFKLE